MVAGFSVVDVPLFNALIPSEGPMGLSLQLDFTVSTSIGIDLTQQQENGIISAVQSAWIDNSNGAAPVKFSIPGVNQSPVIAPGFQGFITLLMPQKIAFTASSTGNGAVVNITLLNIPVSGNLYPTSNAAQNSYTGGRLQVTDPTLDGAITNGLVQVQEFATGSGGVAIPRLIANLTATGTLTNTKSNVISGSPGYFLKAGVFQLSAAATQATAGDWTLTLTDSSGGAIWACDFVTPTAGGVQTVSLPPGFFYDTKAANATLALTASAALTAGKLTYNLNYGLTSFEG